MKLYPCRRTTSDDRYLFLLTWLLFVSYLGIGCQAKSISNASQSKISCNATERKALLMFKSAVETDQCGLLNSWTDQKTNRDCCLWHGVQCNNHTGHVVSLDLGGNDCLEGNLSSSLLELKHLKYLDLSSNHVEGKPFSGFNGSIHQLLANMHSLVHLDLSNNKFYGDIGDAFSGLKRLSYLNLSNNRVQGMIPESFASEVCFTLVELDLSYNNLSGMIPSGFEGCSLLEIFDISSNELSGDLPIDMFLKMDKLKKLVLAFNNFVGTLPDLVYSLGNLELLDLSSNNISGEIPSGICAGVGTKLKELYIQNNLLTGFIPHALGNCSQLVSLDLSFNYLGGRIPSSLGSLSKLKDLIMWMNLLESDIPSELMHNPDLESLILDYNNLNGTIPFGLRNCTKLKWISLSSNNLRGQIPSWIGSLDHLSILKLSRNLFNGQIPPELGDCKSLLWLDLNSNLLSGSIPSTLAKQSGLMSVGLVVGRKYVYLRNVGSNECHGTGNLLEFAGISPEALDRIPTRKSCNFTRIYMGNNRNTQQPFNHNGSMIFLDLSFNNLESSIPKELGSMSYLSILNLRRNNLNGPIPEELGGLKYVGVLDLSYNHLSGQIPASLAGLTLLTEIDLSNNCLSGEIPESGQFETFPDYRFYNNSGLCGYPLTSCSQVGGDRCPSDGSESDDDVSDEDDKYYYVGLYLSLAAGFYVGIVAFFGTLAFKVSWRHGFFRFIEDSFDWVYVRVSIQLVKFQQRDRDPRTAANFGMRRLKSLCYR